MTQSEPADLREQVSSAPRRPAQIIRSDAEAIEVAQRLAEDFAREAAWRDRERRLPWEELDRFSESGLWAISVPKAHGGAGVSYVTLSEVIATISAADSSARPVAAEPLWCAQQPRPDWQRGAEAPLLRQGAARLPFR